MELKLNFDASVINAELECLNCNKRKILNNNETKNSLVITDQKLILNDTKCECGSNVFIADIFVQMKINNKVVNCN